MVGILGERVLAFWGRGSSRGYGTMRDDAGGEGNGGLE